jgi:hypothetical protein
MPVLVGIIWGLASWALFAATFCWLRDWPTVSAVIAASSTTLSLLGVAILWICRNDKEDK